MLEDSMTRSVEVKEGQSFQDRTGLAVRVERIDANNRIHFSVIDYQEGTSAGPGEMSDLSFVNRFTRIDKRSNRKAA
jgi:hypothetical protein